MEVETKEVEEIEETVEELEIEEETTYDDKAEDSSEQSPDDEVTDEKPKADDEEETETDDGLTVTIGEDDESAAAPVWIKDLRRTNRELKRRNKELEQSQLKQSEPEVVLKKPSLEDEGIDYDDDKLADAMVLWAEQKVKQKQNEAEKQRIEQQSAQAWQEKVTQYKKGKEQLEVVDYDDVEAVVTDTLTNEQQGIIVKYSDNPALIVYALGKNTDKLKELSGIQDYIEFTRVLTKLEATLKVNKRKPSSKPESVVKGGGGSVANDYDSQLEKLEKEADRTGNRSKVIAFKRNHKK